MSELIFSPTTIPSKTRVHRNGIFLRRRSINPDNNGKLSVWESDTVGLRIANPPSQEQSSSCSLHENEIAFSKDLTKRVRPLRDESSHELLFGITCARASISYASSQFERAQIVRSLNYAHTYIDILIYYNGILIKTKVRRIKNLPKLDDFPNKSTKLQRNR